MAVTYTRAVKFYMEIEPFLELIISILPDGNVLVLADWKSSKKSSKCCDEPLAFNGMINLVLVWQSHWQICPIQLEKISFFFMYFLSKFIMYLLTEIGKFIFFMSHNHSRSFAQNLSHDHSRSWTFWDKKYEPRSLQCIIFVKENNNKN